MTQENYRAIVEFNLKRYLKRSNKTKRILRVIKFLQDIDTVTIEDYKKIRKDLWKERYQDIDFLEDAIVKIIQNFQK